MKKPQTLSAFTKKELIQAHALLASKVAAMMGRKFEEGDWSEVYCTARNIPRKGWSNLNIDVTYKQFGIEHKMLCVQSSKNIKEHCGTSLMHPALTRSIRVSSTEDDPIIAAREVLDQYAKLVQQRRQKVAESDPRHKPDMRVGWLLWQESLREFLYFEEEMLDPNPGDYWAEWKESGGGARKTSKNLWVYEIKTGRKRYSITTSAGPKIQPYFDVPSPQDPNLYYFCVQGEEVKRGLVRIWVTSTTALLLKQLLGEIDKETLSAAIVRVADSISKVADQENIQPFTQLDLAEPILITAAAYEELMRAFAGVSDEHSVQLFARYISRHA